MQRSLREHSSRRLSSDAGSSGSELNVIVFNEMVSACSWLGLDPSEIRPVLQELRDAPRNDVSV
jgi:hypothetical protein